MLGRHPVERQRVQFILGDSRTFDPEQFIRDHGKPHLVFVDGGHTIDVAVSDTRKAWKLLADGGILAWHDYGTFADVRHAVHQGLREMDRLKDAVWFGGTSIAAVRKPRPEPADAIRG